MNRSAARLIIVPVMILSFVMLAPAAQATFPGKNGKIAFTSDRDGNPYVYVMNATETGQARLTAGSQPAWSPDGRGIAFIHYDPDGTYALYKIDADGTGLVRLPPVGPQASHPTWSPDGTKIAFSSDVFPSGGQDIWIVNADGTDAHALGVGGAAYAPAWSPDGTKIAFMRNDDIYTVGLANGITNRLTTTGGVFPDWSPDGTRIAFSFALDIYLMSADGTGVTNITRSPGQDAYGGYVIYHEPVWSPDATQIAFAHRPPGVLFDDVFVMNADGSDPANLSNNSSIDEEPSWQPIPSPKRSAFKNANQFCKAEQAFWGSQFVQRYRNFGQCVSQS